VSGAIGGFLTDQEEGKRGVVTRILFFTSSEKEGKVTLLRLESEERPER